MRTRLYSASLNVQDHIADDTTFCRKMSSTLQSFVPVLNGTNYQQWAAAMQSYLMSQGQWRVIVKTAPTPVLKPGAPAAAPKEDEEEGATTSAAPITPDEVYENQDVIDSWDEDVSKAVGNIRLRLHHTIAYQYNDIEDAGHLWTTLKEKYGSPGVSCAYIEFKGAMDTVIPNGQDPGPAIDKMLAHWTRLKEIKFDIPEKVKIMMLLAKAPATMETMVQIVSQEKDWRKIQLDNIVQSMKTSWETANRAGGSRQNQQQAHKLSAVKRGGQPPQFQQQQQQQQGDGTWQQPRGK